MEWQCEFPSICAMATQQREYVHVGGQWARVKAMQDAG